MPLPPASCDESRAKRQSATSSTAPRFALECSFLHHPARGGRSLRADASSIGESPWRTLWHVWRRSGDSAVSAHRTSSAVARLFWKRESSVSRSLSLNPLLLCEVARPTSLRSTSGLVRIRPKEREGRKLLAFSAVPQKFALRYARSRRRQSRIRAGLRWGALQPREQPRMPAWHRWSQSSTL
jgi:hypothetical protein